MKMFYFWWIVASIALIIAAFNLVVCIFRCMFREKPHCTNSIFLCVFYSTIGLLSFVERKHVGLQHLPTEWQNLVTSLSKTDHQLWQSAASEFLKKDPKKLSPEQYEIFAALLRDRHNKLEILTSRVDFDFSRENE